MLRERDGGLKTISVLASESCEKRIVVAGDKGMMMKYRRKKSVTKSGSALRNVRELLVHATLQITIPLPSIADVGK